MELYDDIKIIAGDHNELIESMIPERIPSAEILMRKRGKQNNYYLKAGRLGIVYILLIAVFTSLSLFMIDSFRGKSEPLSNSPLNAGIFSSEAPGNMVSAFREAVR